MVHVYQLRRVKGFSVGDKARLIKGRPFAGVKVGETGTVTDVAEDGLSFSINGQAGCVGNYWEPVDRQEYKDRFWELLEKAKAEQAEIEAELAAFEQQEAA